MLKFEIMHFPIRCALRLTGIYYGLLTVNR